MPRKPFEDTPYDPIAADLAREVAAAGRKTQTMVARPVASEPSAGSTRTEIPAVAPATLSPAQPSSPAGPTTAPLRPPVAARTLHAGPIPSTTPPATSPGLLCDPTPTITKRFVVSRAEDADLNAFLLRLQQASGARVPLSVIVRALLTLAMQTESAIVQHLSRHPIRLPSTHDTLALGEFEARWLSALSDALEERLQPSAVDRADTNRESGRWATKY